MRYKQSDGNSLITFLGSIVLLILLPTAVNALLPQISLLLFSHQVLPYGQLRLILLPLLTFFILFSKKKIIINYNIFVPIAALFIYLTINLLVNMFSTNFDYIIYGILSNYYIFFILVITSLMGKFIPYKVTSYTILFTASLCSVLGIIQYVTNDPILPVRDVESGFEVLSWTFFSTAIPHVRAFSLFSSPLEFGLFLVFCIGIALYNVLQGKKLYIPIVLLLVLASVLTLTRNVFLGITFSLIATILYKFFNKKKLLLFFPIISLISGCILALGLTSNNKGITNGETLGARNYYWQQEIRRQTGSNVLELLFGSGLYQTGGENSSTKLFVDNTFLLIVAQIGILGLIIFIWMYFSLLRYIVYSQKNNINAGLYGFLVAWPLMAIFNIIIIQFSVFTIIVLATMDSQDNRYFSRCYKLNGIS